MSSSIWGRHGNFFWNNSKHAELQNHNNSGKCLKNFMWYHVFSAKKERDISLLLKLSNNLARKKKIDEIEKIIVYYLSKHQE